MTATSQEWPLPGNPDESVGARHHRVPRFYLERFANERLQIATVDRRTHARRSAAVRETAAEKDFYTAVNTELSASMEDFQFVPDPNAHLSAMGGMALRISELLLPRPWWIAEYDSPALLTSDEPVALHFRDRSRAPGHDRGIAYADEIWFPLDPRRLLILGRSGDPLPEQRLRPAAETAVTVNLTVAAGAYEHIYMHPAQDHLKGLRLPRPGPLFQVSGDFPIDFNRYNQPVTSTRAQRRR